MIYDGSNQSNLIIARDALLAGELVAFPTETVYGVGADAFNIAAVTKIFSIKNRPANHPLIVHISKMEQISDVVKKFNPLEQLLADKFWPGPLTIVTEKCDKIPFEVTGGLKTVGIRMPNHPVALELISKCGRPIVAPSSNKFQSISPTDAQAVFDELGSKIKIILDGGPCQVGLESTVVRIIDGICEILRPGGVSLEEIQKRTKLKVTYHLPEHPDNMISPGMSKLHYAPKKKFKALSSGDLNLFLNSTVSKKGKLAVICFSRTDYEIVKNMGFMEVVLLSEKGDLYEGAQKLYHEMRRLDGLEIEGILALRPSESEIGLAINDRLTKAEHGF